jgi:hypothetical protein
MRVNYQLHCWIALFPEKEFIVSFAGDSANPRAGLEVMVGIKRTVAVGNGEQFLL